MPDRSHADRVAELERENEELRTNLEEVEAEKEHLARARTRVAGFATGLASRALLGPGLVGRLKVWLHKLEQWRPRKPLPVDETAELGAAILRRVIRVGLFGLLVGALPVILLLWQNFLIREQNAKIQSQIEQQASDTLIVRRAQLLDTIYDEVCEPVAHPVTEGTSPVTAGNGEEIDTEPDGLIEKSGENCRPRAHLRARQEAVIAFVRIERGRGERPDLHQADLRGAGLPVQNLSRVNFVEADLRQAKLNGARLIEAELDRANLSGARLLLAHLFRADLRLTDLHGANLFETILLGADLRATDLRMAKNLTQEQIDSAIGNELTEIPEGLTRPAQWPTSETEWPTSETETPEPEPDQEPDEKD